VPKDFLHDLALSLLVNRKKGYERHVQGVKERNALAKQELSSLRQAQRPWANAFGDSQPTSPLDKCSFGSPTN